MHLYLSICNLKQTMKLTILRSELAGCLTAPAKMARLVTKIYRKFVLPSLLAVCM